MLGAALAALDLSALLRLAFACLLFIAGWIFLTKKNVPCPKALNADFEGKEKFQDRQHMPIGSGGSDTVGVGVSGCPVCAQSASKKCSRCKSVWYCSQECQSKHWKAEHKSKCREMGPADNFDARGTGARRKSSAISLVPGHGTRKVLQEPKKILFPYNEFVKLFDWDKQGFPPCGLLNCGNSCFANVVLQCLACTRPLVAYLLEKDHSRGCLRRRDDWCFLCELQVHIKRASESSQSFSPINILSRLPNIGGNLGYGRQEDAHEFMRFAIDTMQSICLDEFGGEKAVDPSTQETTIVQYIFGGHLWSQVICTNCDVVSNRYENMMDLTVEIHGDSESLEECLDQFTIKEWLDGDNMYKCDGCNDYVKAWKRLTVHQPPNVLTIALKRFQSGRFGKLNKRVTFPEILDLTPYMSGSGDGTDHYTLYGVIVHLDMLNASFFGHYICYTKDYRGIWYKIDDCKVIKVEVEEVLAQGAYMLLYHRINPRKDPFVKPVEPTTNTHLAETDPEISKTRAITESPTHDIISMDAEPQQNILLSETPSEFSTLRDTGHDRHLAECSSGNESEDMDPNAPAAEMTNPAPKFAANGANDIKLENSNFLENASSFEPLPSSKASNPANFSSAEAESEELLSYSNATLLMEEGNDSVDVEVTSELSSKDEDVVMAEASTAPIPSSSEPAAINCDFSIDDSGKKMKPIFSRGFLNKPVHKKPTGCEKAVQPENQGASSSSESNGYSNGHLKFQWDVEMANGNVDDGIISPDPNITSISSGRSNGRPQHHPKAESNGISSFHYNEIKEFGHELPCPSFETSADIRNSACNGDGFGFELGETLSSSSFRDEPRRLNQTNGFSIADFSD